MTTKTQNNTCILRTKTNTKTCHSWGKHKITKPWFSHLLRHPAGNRAGQFHFNPESMHRVYI